MVSNLASNLEFISLNENNDLIYSSESLPNGNFLKYAADSNTLSFNNNSFNMYDFLNDPSILPTEQSTMANPIVCSTIPSNDQQYQGMAYSQPRQQQSIVHNQSQQHIVYDQPQQLMFPPTPPFKNMNFVNHMCPQPSTAMSSRETTPPFTTGDNSPVSQLSTSPSTPSYNHYPLASQPTRPNTNVTRRKSTGSTRRKSTGSTRTYNRRKSSHPSVASVVSLNAHEPESRLINGIEHIIFLYSHDRIVKKYTVRTDLGHVNLDSIPPEFRVQNAIYPRANVPRDEYDGNRWDYETSCNKLGWEICWLNQEELSGRRGLIQRAVDAYRNRHPDMRSRRVTRQEKVANGTLRKRRAKKAMSAIY